MRKSAIWITAIVLAPIVYNLDAIAGRWKYEKLCETEGGLRIFGAVEMDVGWEIDPDESHDYEWPFQFGHVAFVRYGDKQGKISDVHLKVNGNGSKDPEFEFSPVDPRKSVRYRLRYSNKPIPADKRIYRIDWQVIESSSGKLLVSFTRFGYQWATPDRVILSAPTAIQCWTGPNTLEKFYQSIYQSESKK